MARKKTDDIPLTKWIVCIVGPPLLLVVVAVLQVIVRFSLTKTTDAYGAMTTGNSAALTVVNIISILVGIVAYGMLLLEPLWIILLVKTINYNNATESHRLSKTAAVVFAILFGAWAWVYTYERTKTKFWINAALTVCTLGLWGIVAWVWAIVDMCRLSERYFSHYPDVAS